jgi:thioredoxin reductase
VYFAHTQEPTDNESAELAARGIHVIHGRVARLVIADDHLTGVDLDDGRFIPRPAVFVRPIMTPHFAKLLVDLGSDLDGDGFPIADRTGRTSVTGVWAAGNVADPRAQVITAAGAGSAAAIAINADLLEDDVATAMRAAHELSAMRSLGAH